MVIVFVIVFIFVFSKGIEVLTSPNPSSYSIPYDGPAKSVFEKWLPFSKENNGKNCKKFTAILMSIILISTVIAVGIEIKNMFLNQSVTLADLLLMFLYLEVLSNG